jgi:uncharacterized protein (TIGR02186 family)
MIRLIAFLAILVASMAPATEPRLIPDVSEREVEIRYSFAGAELLLFGAILYPGGQPSGDVDIAVVLKGPSQPMVVREKQKHWGIWVNADKSHMASVPGFYAIASTRPIGKILDARTAAIYELGLPNLHLSPGEANASLERFEAGLRDLKTRQRLYAEHPGTVELIDGALYRARLPVPARVPTGTFTAETFLIRHGRVITAETRNIEIKKTGFEKFVADSAQDFPLTYGLVAVLLSLLLGWAAGVLFRRD